MDWLNSIDIYFFRLINSVGFKEMDPIMILISNKFFWIPFYLYLVFLLYKKDTKNFLWVLISIGILIFLSDFGSVHFFKDIFERLRPCYQLENIRIVDECGGQYGFVSSHASNSFALAFFIGLIFRNIKGFSLLFSWGVLIGFSRVYLGVHFPFDILGGMFWGLFVSLFVFKIYKLKMK